MSEQIVILDFGSQYTQVIARRIRECNVFSNVLPFDTPFSKIKALKPKGIILSGGPSSVFAKDAPLPNRKIFDLGLPVLGICYGVQLLGHFLGGKIESSEEREYGRGTLK
ncbi:MAG: glutamine amidotransferase-related protein, partial [Verrucomicrobiia bacterium]